MLQYCNSTQASFPRKNRKLENILKNMFTKQSKQLKGENAKMTGNWWSPVTICSNDEAGFIFEATVEDLSVLY